MDMMLHVVLAILLGMVTADLKNITDNCPDFPNAPSVTFDNLTGAARYYVKYSKSPNNLTDEFDGVAVEFKKANGTKNYTITFTIVTSDGEKVVISKFAQYFPSRDELVTYNPEIDTIRYTIPYFDNSSVAVVYSCRKNGSPKVHVDVLTTSLDNDMTKALEAVKNITQSNLIELPYKQKDKFFP